MYTYDDLDYIRLMQILSLMATHTFLYIYFKNRFPGLFISQLYLYIFMYYVSHIIIS